MITEAYQIDTFLDGGTKEISYTENGVEKICFIDYSIGTKNRGKIYEKMVDNIRGHKFVGELDEQKSLMIKLLLETNEGK